MCSEKDRQVRNCGNFNGLSDAARAVEAYDEAISEELAAKGSSKVISLGDLRLYECPLSYISEETFDVMRCVFLMESSGGLYFEGGLADQPCWLVEAYEICQLERTRLAGERDGVP